MRQHGSETSVDIRLRIHSIQNLDQKKTIMRIIILIVLKQEAIEIAGIAHILTTHKVTIPQGLVHQYGT